MKIIKKPVAALAATAIALVAVAIPAAGASAAESISSVYLAHADTAADLGGGPIGWEQEVVFTPDSSSPDTVFDPENRFQGSADATQSFVFVSDPGDELDMSQWYGRDFFANSDSAWIPTVSLINLTDWDHAGDYSDVKTNGGTYSFGLVFTKENGNQVASAGGFWVTIEVTAGTGEWTYVDTVGEEPETFPNWTQFSETADAATLSSGNLLLDAGVANAGKTVDVYAEGTTAPVNAAVELSASGTAIISGSSIAAGTRIAIVEGETVLAWGIVAAEQVAPVEPTDAANAATKVTVTPSEDGKSVTIAAGAANADKTLNAWAWSDPTNLGQVTTDANGNATVNVSSLPSGAHTIALAEADFEIVAWGTAETVSSDIAADTDLTVDVITSGRFELNGVTNAVDLGETERGSTTDAVAFPNFTVVDDRDQLSGWQVTAAVEDFVNAEASGDVIPKAALGLKPVEVSSVPGITLGAEQTAGEAVYTSVFAEANAGSTTGEAGAQFAAELRFAAPTTAKAGTYNSTLTLTLSPK